MAREEILEGRGNLGGPRSTAAYERGAWRKFVARTLKSAGVYDRFRSCMFSQIMKIRTKISFSSSLSLKIGVYEYVKDGGQRSHNRNHPDRCIWEGRAPARPRPLFLWSCCIKMISNIFSKDYLHPMNFLLLKRPDVFPYSFLPLTGEIMS